MVPDADAWLVLFNQISPPGDMAANLKSDMSAKRFISLWLFSAALLSLVRFLYATDPGYDLTYQIQAAQNLWAGNGLAVYSVLGEDDLAAPNKLETLTYYSAGYSLALVPLLAIGLSAATGVKVLGVVATILGWWGWARLACSFFGDGLKRGHGWKWTAAGVAIFTPLSFTLPWGGTDIFLWAAVPWILAFVTKGANQNKSKALWFDLLAGLVCGACVLARYAGVSFALYAAFLILCQSGNRLPTLLRRGAAFATGFLPSVAVQFYLNHFISVRPTTPGGLSFGGGHASGIQIFWDQAIYLTTANFSLVWWSPKLAYWFHQPVNRAPWLLAITLGVFALPVLLARKLKYVSLAAAARDIRPAAAGLLVALPLSLWAYAFFGVYYLGVPRYYQPLVPLAVLIAFTFAGKEDGAETAWASLFRKGGLLYLGSYLGIILFGAAFFFQSGNLGAARRARLMGTKHFGPRPSMAMSYEASPARRWVLDLLKQEPGTVLLTNLPQWFYADGRVDRSRLHRFDGVEVLRSSYINGPARLLIMARELEGTPDEELYWFTDQNKPRRVRYFDPVPDLRLLRRFPEENIKVLEARLPAGSRVPLDKHPPDNPRA